ncbi:hypothetical protein MKX01_032320, partial [Papaver californicum]
NFSNGAIPCQYHSVISEFIANGTASNPSSAARVEPLEVRRIITMGIAFRGAHGGQILFGPDGYLYFMTRDDESEADSYNFGQNKKSLLGKILRFDVENIPSATEISKLDLETIPFQKIIHTMTTKNCDLKSGPWDLEILGAVVLIQRGHLTLFVEMLARINLKR